MFSEFCCTENIVHERSAPLTPQQNSVIGRNNKTLQKMARVMLHAKNLPLYYWAEASIQLVIFIIELLFILELFVQIISFGTVENPMLNIFMSSVVLVTF